MNKKDYYEVLGVKKTATPDEIKKAYRKLAKELHPDKGGDENAFKEVSAAYETLSDMDKKSSYDRFGHEGPRMRGGNPFGFSAEDIFGNFNHPPERFGPNKNLLIKVTLEEIYSGVSKKYNYTRQDTCKTCHGHGGIDIDDCSLCGGSGNEFKILNTPIGIMRQSMPCSKCEGRGKTYTQACGTCSGRGTTEIVETIEVNIPSGVQEGMTFVMAEKGDGIKGGKCGDLLINIQELPHKLYIRNGNDLKLNLKLTYPQLILGEKVEIETIEGGKIRVSIPEYSDVGTSLRIQAKGLKPFKGDTRGDIVIILGIDIPKKISDDAKASLIEFKEKLEENVG
jgi:molecular chaperone DnaJ